MVFIDSLTRKQQESYNCHYIVCFLFIYAMKEISEIKSFITVFQ